MCIRDRRHTFFWVRHGLGAAGWLAAALSPYAVRDGESALAGVRAQSALGIVNGVTGHRLAEDGSSLAFRMSLRVDGRDVAPTPDGLAAAYGTGDAAETGPARVVVFLHAVSYTHLDVYKRQASISITLYSWLLCSISN